MAGQSVAMATYSVVKVIPTCPPMIGQFFVTMIAASTDKDSSKSTSWKVLETVLSHLNLGSFVSSESRWNALPHQVSSAVTRTSSPINRAGDFSQKSSSRER